MKKTYIKTAMLFMMLLFYSFSKGQNLIHYWHFNNNSTVATLTTPTVANVSGASLTANISGSSAIDPAAGTGSNFSLSNLNAQNGDPSGTHLRFNLPIGSNLVFALPTTGYQNIVVKFATNRSGSGAGTQVWSYSIDGTNYSAFTNVIPSSGNPALATLDFSAITAANNNANFKIKVEFQQGGGGTVGNNRFDNFTAEGTSLGGGSDTTAPVATILPINGAINVNAGVNPTIAFNESVRLSDNSAITNANVDAVVELRLNNASGVVVPFDATFASNTITINPTSNLANNQSYYVALLSNTIEDGSDNAITTTQSTSFTTSTPSTSSIDLSTYVRVARYNLPEPLTTSAPTNNLLCQEASAVAYNWDTDTLFITADGSTSVTQVSKTGVLIDTMTMAQGSSPQGTDFYDTEGITYIGNGQFVMSEERDRQLVKFTYAAGTTLTRANAQTVKIGTFVPNTGTEGLCYDPLTGGFICLKEIGPIGIFQTNVDFAAGTATNGSATTVNSVDLFDPALLGFSDVADVFVLANLPTQSTSTNLLVLSQENAQVVNIDRNGNIASTLTIVADQLDTLSAPAQQHEGITMDNNGIIYIVNENGGGDINHPQLWVYAPSTGTNVAPTAIALTNTVPSIIENAITTPAVKVADILLTDDGLGTNTYSLSGADALSFQITGASLFIKPGTVLDFETKSTFNVTVNVDDTTVGATPDASVNFVLSVTDLVDETPQLPSVTISEVAPWGSGNSPAAADWFEVTNNGATALNITGWKVDDNSNSFAASLALTGITSIAPGESVIFMESSAANPAATVTANFKSLWFGANPPASLQVGTYQGSGIGLSTGGDAVNLYDAAGVLQANVIFGASPTVLFKTFNNAVGLNSTAISLLSEVGVNDAFVAVNDVNEIGSPGSVGRLFVSEVAPWSSGNSPVGSDWFEVTNTKAVAVNIAGWKMDDNSQSPAGAVALNGIASINPGESVIFIETSDLPGKTSAFLNNWFGTNPSGSLRIGNYTGSGVGLGTGGDQVNLYNSSNVLQTSVLFGSSPATAPYTTFDNKIGINSLVTPITPFSAVSVNGAFIAANSSTEIGSPGTIVTAPCPTINVTAQPTSSITCSGGTTTVVVTATGGTTPYAGTGTFTAGAGAYSYTVTDAKGCNATATGTLVSVPDTTSPSIYFQPSALLTGATGPSTTQSPYLQSQSLGGKYTSILSVNDAVGGYKMVGIPDGLGAYDNNNGTFTLLMNHELGNTAGITRAHGSAGAFVSKWIINKSNLAVQSGSDLIQTVNTWNTTSNSFVTGTTAFNRFCSADLPSIPALYNAATGLGTKERIFLTGEESGAEGRAFGHIVTGATAGVSYELPYLGKFSWENVVASPASGNKTVVAGTDDATTNGQVYFYVGTKTNTGTEIDKAGLNNGKLFGVNVTGLTSESSSSIPAANTVFTLSDLGFVQNKTGATLNTESVTAGVTNFLRPEDGGFDPSNPNDFYFVTTNSITAPSRMWRLRFNDIANPETGGTITAVLDGTEGQKMLDNMTIDKLGHILLQEDPGGNAHNAKMWQYTIATDALELVGKHDPARFGDLVGGVTTPATSPYNNDEESSGVIDMSDILGPGMFLIDDQAHYTTGLANLSEVVQGGQLLAFFNPASVSATVSTAASATITACSGTGVVLGTPATADNCSIVSLTNDAPTTFPVGTTTVTWTATDSNGNTSTATQNVTVANASIELSLNTNTSSETAGTVVTVTATASKAVCADETVNVDVTGLGITAADYTLSNATITIPSGSTTGSVTFTVVNDNVVEPTETAVVTISNPSSGIALGTITTQNIAISDFAFTLQVLHASDFEGAVEAVQDAPRFAAIVDVLEDTYANTIKLSSGDNYIPGPFLSSGEDPTLSAALKTAYESYYNTTFSSSAINLLPSIGRADISILNFIGIEASALGNHEFDLGTTEVRNIIRGANSSASVRSWFGAQFPYLSSNLNFSADSNLSAIATTNRLLPNTSFQSNPTEAVSAITNKLKLAPSTIIMKGGQKIGIVGATTQVLASISSPGATTVVGGGANDMTILAGIVQPVVNSLIADGCNKIILLSHLQQIAFEKELAGKLTGVDIIMAGGSNTLMADANDRLRSGDVASESYPFLTTGLDGKALALINTDGNYKYVGRLVVDFDADGTLIPSSINSLISGVYAADAQGLNDVWGANVGNAFAVGTRGYQVQLLCTAINNVIIAKDGNLFGKTAVFLEGQRNFVRTQETNLGNITAEANLWLAKFYDPTTVISIKNGGGIRSAIGNVIAVGDNVTYAPPIANPSAGKQSGDISQLDIENSLRFNNQLSIVTLTASGLRSVLEHAVAATNATATPGQFAQVAGVRYSYNFSNAVGSRILNAVVTDANGNVIDTLVLNGTTVGNLSRTFRVVTLNFLAGGGDSYPFNTLGTSRVDLNTVTAQGPAAASFTNAGSEQDAFAEFMKNQYSTTPYGIADTPLVNDCRIQRIPARADNVIPPSAGSNGTLSIALGATVVESQLFAALVGTPQAGGTWSPAAAGAGVYTYTVTSLSCSGSSSATVTVTETIPTTMSFCQGAKVASAIGTTSLKFYSAATGGTLLLATATLTTRTVFATLTVNGVETAPRVAVSIIVNPLPSDVVGTITSNTPSATSPTGFDVANIAVGQFVGTTTTVSYRIPASVGPGLSYLWKVPAGVTIVGQAANVTEVTQTGTNANILNVHYNNVPAGVGIVGAISVRAANANGCGGIAKSITVSKALPFAPIAITMTDAALPLVGGIPTAITTFAQYMGTSKEVTLTATTAATATSYVWELPTGVNVTNNSAMNTNGVISSTSNVITVNFLGVTNTNTYNYMSTDGIPTSTNNLRIGVYSKNGTGLSTTDNTALTNSSPSFVPNSTSTARLLTLTAVRPAAPAALKMYNAAASLTVAVIDISKFIGTSTPLTLIATPARFASAYSWELPAFVNVAAGSDITSSSIVVNFQNVPAGTSSFYIGVKAVNGMGASITDNSALTLPTTTSEAKLLKVTAKAPAVAGIVNGSLAICATTASSVVYSIPTAAIGANTYEITVPIGCTINGGTTTTASIDATAGVTFTVNYPAAFVANTSTAIKTIAIQSVNGFGVSGSKILKLTNVGAICTLDSKTSDIALFSNGFVVTAFPVPSTDVFTIAIQSPSTAMTSVDVYDMQGRLIDNFKSNATSFKLGSTYPTGVYMVIVAQESNVKTLRVVKK